jgi:uncharacterized Fe-S cluster-containing radical SAM superfamily protein
MSVPLTGCSKKRSVIIIVRSEDMKRTDEWPFSIATTDWVGGKMCCGNTHVGTKVLSRNRRNVIPAASDVSGRLKLEIPEDRVVLLVGRAG